MQNEATMRTNIVFHIENKANMRTHIVFHHENDANMRSNVVFHFENEANMKTFGSSGFLVGPTWTRAFPLHGQES